MHDDEMPHPNLGHFDEQGSCECDCRSCGYTSTVTEDWVCICPDCVGGTVCGLHVAHPQPPELETRSTDDDYDGGYEDELVRLQAAVDAVTKICDEHEQWHRDHAGDPWCPDESPETTARRNAARVGRPFGGVLIRTTDVRAALAGVEQEAETP